MEGKPKKGRVLRRIVAVVCSVALVMETVPQTARALPEGEGSEGPAPEQVESWEEEGVILGENTERRTEESKEFVLSDGTNMIAMYGTPIHYQDEEGKWQEYDNRLTEDVTLYSLSEEREYKTQKSDIEIRLGNKAKAKKLVSIKGKGGERLSWGYEGAANQKIEILEEGEGEEEGNEAYLKLKKIKQEAWYRDAFEEVDLQYIVEPKGVKENLVLKSARAQKEFILHYIIDELNAEQVDERTIELKNAEGETIYTLRAPEMRDAAGERSEGVTLTITERKNKKLTVKLTGDEEWLEAPERTYPVTLDPYVTTEQDRSKIDNVSVNSQTTSVQTEERLLVGYNKYGVSRSYLNFELPTLEAGAVVTQAILNLFQYEIAASMSEATSPYVYVYDVTGTGSYEIPKLTWSSQPSGMMKKAVLDYSQMLGVNEWKHFDISKAVKKWYAQGLEQSQTILGLASSDESVMQAVSYYGVNYNKAEYQQKEAYPIVQIVYLHNGGVEGYRSYVEQDVGQAGSGHIDAYTGNLTFTVPVFATTGNRMPVGLSFTYNGYEAGKYVSDKDGVSRESLQNGYGWQISVNRRIERVENPAIKEKFPLAMLDADGTRHYFKQTSGNANQYEDEEGQGTTIEYRPNESVCKYRVTYKNGYREDYTAINNTGLSFLVYERDTDNNYIQYSYGGGILHTITDGAKRTVKLGRDEGAGVRRFLKSITYDEHTVQVEYTDWKYLSKITYPDGTWASYSYDSSHRLTKVLNSDGTGVEYEYQSNPRYASERNRVVKMTQLYNTSSKGGMVSISYGSDNTTTIVTDSKRTGDTSTDQTKETRIFSNIGQLTGVVTPEGCSTYSYKGKSGDSTQRNKVTSASEAQPLRRNYVKNHNIEAGTANWAASNWSGANQTVGIESSHVYLGKKALRVTKTTPGGTGGYYQDVELTPGNWYTLSTYTKVIDIQPSVEGGGAGVYATFWKYNESGNLELCGPKTLGPRISRNTSVDGWDRVTVTFQVPEGTDIVSIYGGITNATGTAYFDCFQLENAMVVASDYNLLTNPTFHSASDWSMSNGASYVINPTTGFHRAYIIGDPRENRYVSQNVSINKANLSFRYSGKAGGAAMDTGYETGGSVPIAYPRYFALDLGIFYADGTSEYVAVSFNPDSTGEQFVTGTVQTKKDVVVSSVTFFVLYYRNVNRIWTDDLSLNIDTTGTAYDYDSKGNLISAKDNAGNKKIYDYDGGSNELVKVTDETRSESYSYTYDTGNKHRLLAAQSNQTGIGFRYGCNEVGGVTSTQMGTLNSSGVLDTTKPYIETKQSYNDEANYANRIYDQRGNLTSLAVGHMSGLVYSSTDPKGNVTQYTYDSAWRMTGMESGGMTAGYAYDSQSRLSAITHNGFQYGFSYDTLGNPKTVSIQSGTSARQLIQKAYWPNSGLLKLATYGNGDTRYYSYNQYGQLVQKRESESSGSYLLWNEYDATGTLAVSHDNEAGEVHYYQYDLAGRLEARNTSPYSGSASSVRYEYDNQNRLTGESYAFRDGTHSNTYTYGEDSRLVKSTLFGGEEAQHLYDSLGREYQTNLVAGDGGKTALTTNYTFVGVSGNRTTTLVSNYKVTAAASGIVVSDTYTYDSTGNIESIRDRNGQVISYEYDMLNQLVRENNPVTKTTTVYQYDGEEILFGGSRIHTRWRRKLRGRQREARPLPMGTTRGRIC